MPSTYPFQAGHSTGSSGGKGLVMVEQVVVRGGKGRHVRCTLLRATLGEHAPAIQDQANGRNDGDQRQCKDDDDLALIVAWASMMLAGRRD